VAIPSEPSLAIFKTFIGKGPQLIAPRMDVIEREATVSDDRTISGTISEGYTIK
jgi:hypothetical protein